MTYGGSLNIPGDGKIPWTHYKKSRLIPPFGLPPPRKSWRHVLAELPPEELPDLLKESIGGGDPDEFAYAMSRSAAFTLRREQFPPKGEWWFWMVRAGRGWGKTFCGAAWIVDLAANQEVRGTAIVAATASDMTRFCINGPSGILSTAPPGRTPRHVAGENARLVWDVGGDTQGSIETYLFSAESPDRLRGPSLEKVWCDELAKWKRLELAWDNLMFSLREGEEPQVIATTTPRPIRMLKELEKEPGVVVTGGAMYDNIENLSPKFIGRMRSMYEGTAKARQELHGEYVEEAEGALWTRAALDDTREPRAPTLRRIVVGVDPAASSKDTSDEVGIVVVGEGEDRHGYALEDLSKICKPEEWATRTIRAYFRLNANLVIAERNNGGEMVEEVISMHARELHRRKETPSPHVPVKLVWASHGKAARAEPIALLYEQRRFHHVGTHQELEDEMCGWEPGSGARSPSRLDALVWAASYLTGARPEDWSPSAAEVIPLPAAASWARESGLYDPDEM